MITKPWQKGSLWLGAYLIIFASTLAADNFSCYGQEVPGLWVAITAILIVLCALFTGRRLSRRCPYIVIAPDEIKFRFKTLRSADGFRFEVRTQVVKSPYKLSFKKIGLYAVDDTGEASLLLHHFHIQEVDLYQLRDAATEISRLDQT